MDGVNTTVLFLGDTIIKREGETILNIHKKDTILAWSWECEG